MKRTNLFLLVLVISISTYAQVVWEPTNLSALCPSITVSSTGVLYAGSMTGDVYKSTDNGSNWTSSNIGSSFNIADIEIAGNGNIFLTTTENGVYRSTDNGGNWQHILVTSGMEARDIEIKGGTIFVSTKDHGLGKSTDNGETWSPASSSVPENNIGAFVVTNNGALLIGVKGSNGLYRSTDDGATWSLTNFPLSYRVYSFTVASNNYIFAGTGEYLDGIYRSTDDGATWQKLNGASTSFEYKTNGIYTTDGKLLLGVYNSGIYGSTDLGNSWQFFNDGLQSLIGFFFAQAPNGIVYATTGAGVYKNTGTTDVNESEISLNNFALHQNYPNPFNPATTIQYIVPKLSSVLLKICDVLGNEVAVLVDEEQPSGFYKVDFNASHLSSGVYFYTLLAGNYFQTKKMILIQ